MTFVGIGLGFGSVNGWMMFRLCDLIYLDLCDEYTESYLYMLIAASDILPWNLGVFT